MHIISTFSHHKSQFQLLTNVNIQKDTIVDLNPLILCEYFVKVLVTMGNSRTSFIHIWLYNALGKIAVPWAFVISPVSTYNTLIVTLMYYLFKFSCFTEKKQTAGYAHRFIMRSTCAKFFLKQLAV
jgi:cell shape-determining protein MreD